MILYVYIVDTKHDVSLYTVIHSKMMYAATTESETARKGRLLERPSAATPQDINWLETNIKTSK